MRNVTLLGSRVVVGTYLAVHGAQILFGSFHGHGLEATGHGFDMAGLRPGRQMATLAGATNLAGGVFTAAGILDPLGPLAIMGTMAVASVLHRRHGPLNAKGGYELALTNLAAAAALAATGPGELAIGPKLPGAFTRVAAIAGAAAAVTIARRVLRAGSAPQDATLSHATVEVDSPAATTA